VFDSLGKSIRIDFPITATDSYMILRYDFSKSDQLRLELRNQLKLLARIKVAR